MDYKEKQNWLGIKYPCTVIADRYYGTYSNATYLAFPLDFDDVPKDVNGGDTECAYFWGNYKEPVGKGASAQAAIDDLVAQMENEDESIRKDIIHILQVGGYMSPEKKEKAFAYLEKQKENIEKEYVFRPSIGTDITIAAEQAIRRANEGDRLVLAFNGAYIPVRKGCNAQELVDEYDAYLEKQKLKKKGKDYTFTINKIQDEFYLGEGNAFFPIDQQDTWELVKPNLVPGQKPAEWSEDEEKIISNIRHLIFEHAFENGGVDVNGDYCKDVYEQADAFLESLGMQQKQEWSEVELTFRGEKVKVKRPFFRDDKDHRYSTTEQDEDVAWYALRAWCEKKGISMYDLYPREEWSDEDDKTFELLHTCACRCINDDRFDYAEREQISRRLIPFIERLSSLRSQPKQEWDGFDEDCLKRAIWYVENPAPSVVKDTNLVLWLKSLPERFNLQPKQEWSDEDEKMRINILNALTPQLIYSVGKGTSTGTSTYKYDNEIRWLESLKNRGDSLKSNTNSPSWKPSEEQIEALQISNSYWRGLTKQVPNTKELESLLQDLKNRR